MRWWFSTPNWKVSNMMRRILGLLLAVSLPLFILVTTLSQEPQPRIEGVPTPGHVVRAIATAPIREGPPSGYRRLPGHKIGATKANSDYVISNVSTSPYLFSTQTWIELSVEGENDAIGWVYWGSEDDVSNSKNFMFERIVTPSPETLDQAHNSLEFGFPIAEEASKVVESAPNTDDSAYTIE